MLTIKMKEYFNSRREELLEEFQTYKEAYATSLDKDHYNDMNRAKSRLFELNKTEEYFDNLLNEE